MADNIKFSDWILDLPVNLVVWSMVAVVFVMWLVAMGSLAIFLYFLHAR